MNYCFPLGSLTEIGAPALLWRTWSRDRVGQCKLMGAILTVSDSVFIRGRLSINCQIACQTLQCLHWFASNQSIGILNKLAANSIITSISRFKLKYFLCTWLFANWPIFKKIYILAFGTAPICRQLARTILHQSFVEYVVILQYYFKGFHDKVYHLNKYMVLVN